MSSNKLDVLLIDPPLGSYGLNNPAIPLAAGLMATYLKKHLPEINITVLKVASRIVKQIRETPPDILAVST